MRRITKHADEIAFFNRLVADLASVVREFPIIADEAFGLTKKRLNEATRHLAKLGKCKEKVKFK